MWLVTRPGIEAVAAVIARDPVRDVAVVPAPPELTTGRACHFRPTRPRLEPISAHWAPPSASTSR